MKVKLHYNGVDIEVEMNAVELIQVSREIFSGMQEASTNPVVSSIQRSLQEALNEAQTTSGLAPSLNRRRNGGNTEAQ